MSRMKNVFDFDFMAVDEISRFGSCSAINLSFPESKTSPTEETSGQRLFSKRGDEYERIGFRDIPDK